MAPPRPFTIASSASDRASVCRYSESRIAAATRKLYPSLDAPALAATLVSHRTDPRKLLPPPRIRHAHTIRGRIWRSALRDVVFSRGDRPDPRPTYVCRPPAHSFLALPLPDASPEVHASGCIYPLSVRSPAHPGYNPIRRHLGSATCTHAGQLLSPSVWFTTDTPRTGHTAADVMLASGRRAPRHPTPRRATLISRLTSL